MSEQLPPAGAVSSRQDAEHLRLLSIFHYVVAGLAALFACFPIVHLVVGLLLTTGALGDDDPGARVVGLLFAVIGALVILAGWTFAVLVMLCGRYLSGRRNYTYCLVMGGVECLFMPFGTVLGVFTLLVLTRESVKRMFGCVG